MATLVGIAALRRVGTHMCRSTEPILLVRSSSRLVCPKKTGGSCRDCKIKLPTCTSNLTARKVSTARTAIRHEAPLMPTTGPTMTAVRGDHMRGMLITQWSDGTQNEFPFLWLRDNCQCSKCFHKSATQRLFVMENLNVNVEPTNVHFIQGTVHITWTDGHSSSFESSWLRDHQFTQTAQQQRSKWLPRKAVMWGSEMQDNIPKGSYDEIMSTDEAFHDWLCAMEDKGLFLIQGAPAREGVLTELGKRVAFLKTTNYGAEHNVVIKPNSSNLTYTNARLGLHTDLPYYNYCPGVQILMCIQNVPTKGGENEFADGFHVAEVMRRDYPEEFRILTNTPVQFVDIGTDYYQYHKLHSSPTIELNDEGAVVRIAYNNQVRDSVQDMDPEEVAPFYRALKLFDDLLYQHSILYKLKPGELICFHNYRVLHGRTGFQILSDGVRHLVNGFMDWDELYSRRRVLQAKLDRKSRN